MIANPARAQLNRGNLFFLFLFAPEDWSHKTYSAVPSRFSPFFVHTQAESGAVELVCYRYFKNHSACVSCSNKGIVFVVALVLSRMQ